MSHFLITHLFERSLLFTQIQFTQFCQIKGVRNFVLCGKTTAAKYNSVFTAESCELKGLIMLRLLEYTDCEIIIQPQIVLRHYCLSVY